MDLPDPDFTRAMSKLAAELRDVCARHVSDLGLPLGAKDAAALVSGACAMTSVRLISLGMAHAVVARIGNRLTPRNVAEHLPSAPEVLALIFHAPWGDITKGEIARLRNELQQAE